MMQNIRAVSASALVALLAACDMEPRPVEANGPARFVVGELIVKFKDASDYGKRIAQAMALGERPPDIERLAQQLSGELDMPLTAVRVTSGRELLLQIDRAAFGQGLTEQVRKNPAVRAVQLVPPAAAVLPTAKLSLMVALNPESEEQKLVANESRAGRRAGGALDRLANRLVGGTFPVPTGALNEQGELLLIVDIAALTQNLVERLQRRPDVEYAQLSHILKPYGGAIPGR